MTYIRPFLDFADQAFWWVVMGVVVLLLLYGAFTHPMIFISIMMGVLAYYFYLQVQKQ
jgi:hypothetical protein